MRFYLTAHSPDSFLEGEIPGLMFGLLRRTANSWNRLLQIKQIICNNQQSQPLCCLCCQDKEAFVHDSNLPTPCRSLACVQAFGNNLELHAHRTPKTNAPQSHTLRRACTSSIAQRMAWLREQENPKRKINKTAAARCAQRCCCDVHLVRYRWRGHEALTCELVKFRILQDQLSR